MLYSCTHMASVGVKRLTITFNTHNTVYNGIQLGPYLKKIQIEIISSLSAYSHVA